MVPASLKKGRGRWWGHVFYSYYYLWSRLCLYWSSGPSASPAALFLNRPPGSPTPILMLVQILTCRRSNSSQSSKHAHLLSPFRRQIIHPALQQDYLHFGSKSRTCHDWLHAGCSWVSIHWFWFSTRHHRNNPTYFHLQHHRLWINYIWPALSLSCCSRTHS